MQGIATAFIHICIKECLHQINSNHVKMSACSCFPGRQKDPLKEYLSYMYVWEKDLCTGLPLNPCDKDFLTPDNLSLT